MNWHCTSTSVSTPATSMDVITERACPRRACRRACHRAMLNCKFMRKRAGRRQPSVAPPNLATATTCRAAADPVYWSTPCWLADCDRVFEIGCRREIRAGTFARWWVVGETSACPQKSFGQPWCAQQTANPGTLASRRPCGHVCAYKPPAHPSAHLCAQGLWRGGAVPGVVRRCGVRRACLTIWEMP